MTELLNKEIRRRIIEQGSKLGFGHYGSAMSCVDIVVFLYNNVLTNDDVFIMSKGHGIIACLPILEKKYPNIEWNPYLDYSPQFGIEATTASLGHGLPIAVGRALGKKLQNKKGKIYCMLGDGDIQEGSNWEALQIANKLELDNLIILIDYNYYQALDSVENVLGMTPKNLMDKLMSFGYNVMIISGHKEEELKLIKSIPEYMKKGIWCFILQTQKGRGIKYLEDNPSVHVFYFHEHPDILNKTLEELK